MDKQRLLIELKNWIYVDQILFRTERALNLLRFEKEVHV